MSPPHHPLHRRLEPPWASTPPSSSSPSRPASPSG
jgi:hypothetical protein